MHDTASTCITLIVDMGKSIILISIPDGLLDDHTGHLLVRRSLEESHLGQLVSYLQDNHRQ